jgi:hypothetical protein
MNNNTQKYELPDEYKDALSNLNEFSNLAKQNNLLNCNENCIKNINDKKIYNNYLKQKSNLINAEKMFEISEKNYVISDKGYDYYNDMKLKKYQDESEKIINKMNDKFKNITELIEEKIQNNNLLNKSLQNTDELNIDYNKKISNLKHEIDTNENKGNISNRITYYNNQKINFWCLINYYVKLLFWILFILYLVISIIYKQYNKTLVRISLILLPFLAFFEGHEIYRFLRSYL